MFTKPKPHILTSLSWFLFGLGFVYGLTSVVSFSYHSETGIVSWVSRNEYPKIKEVFWFLTFTTGIPLLVYVGQLFDSTLVRGQHHRLRRVSWLIPLLPFFGLIRLDSLFAYWASFFSAMLCAMIGIWVKKKCSSRVDRVRGEINKTFPVKNADVFSWKRKRDLLFLLKALIVLLAGSFMIYQQRFFPEIGRSVDLFHEGEFLLPLHEFWNGAIPYRDIYLQHGFMHNLGVPFLGAKLFGYDLASVRAIHILLNPLGWVGAYIFLCCLTRFNFLACLAFVCFSGMTHIHVQERAFFGCCALAVLALSLHKKSGVRTLNILNGLFCALALLYSVEVGLYASAASLLIHLVLELLKKKGLWEPRGHSIIQHSFGYFLGMFPFLLYLFYHGAISGFLENISIQVLYQLEVWGRAFPNPLQMLAELDRGQQSFLEWLFSKKVSLVYAPVLLAVSGAILAHRLRCRERAFTANSLNFLLLILAGIFFFRTNLGRSDSGHFSYNYMISLLIVCFGIYGVLCKGKGCIVEKKWGSSLVGVILLATLFWVPWNWIEKNTPDHYVRKKERVIGKTIFPLPKDHEIIPQHQFDRIQAFNLFVEENTRPEDRLYDFSNQCAHLFFAERKSASPFFMPVYAVLEEHQKVVISDLETWKVPYILYRSYRYFRAIDGFNTSHRTPFLHQYIKENYSKNRWVGGIEVWKRNELP